MARPIGEITSGPPILWSLNKGLDQTLPVLHRFGSLNQAVANSNIGENVLPTRTYSGGTVRAIDIIDVVNDFFWTKSPQTSRTNTPYLTMIEKRLIMNSNLSNIANSVFAVVDSGATVANSLGDALKYIGNSDTGKPVINAFTGLNPGEFGGAVTAGASESIPGQAFKNVTSYINNFTRNNFDTFDNSVLKPYEFLYSTEKTGFIYKLPYLENEYNNSAISFGEPESNVISGISSIARNFAEGIAGIVGALKPGTYIERAKQFTMGDKGRTISVKFPLLNTRQYNDILVNWQLIFGLIYQNRPGRVTRSIIDMPVIYEVQIPGVVYMPFAYISSLQINFLGSRRTMPIQVPITENSDVTGALTTVTTVIPDAYEVSITLEGMNEETRNFLYANVVRDSVTVAGEVQ